MKEQRKRCAAWAMRRSPDEREIWLNWAARDKQTHQVMAHFQVGIKEDQVATVAYLVARAFQRQGFAYEGLKTVFEYLREEAHVREVKVWSDTRNAASHGLARKLGMIQVDTIKDADYFKGASSDEFVFSKRLHEPPERISIRPLKSSDIEKIVRYLYDSPRADLDRMGVDVERLPPRKEMMNSLLDVASIPAGQASSCYMIWEIGGVSVGFSSLKDIIPGEHGGMHLHMWDVGSRGRGFGAELFCRSALEFYRLYKLPTIFCEPSSKNPMPNGMLRKLGFPLIRTYRGRSSALSAETELNRYEVTRSVAERFLKENGRAARFEAAATSESGMSL